MAETLLPVSAVTLLHVSAMTLLSSSAVTLLPDSAVTLLPGSVVHLQRLLRGRSDPAQPPCWDLHPVLLFAVGRSQVGVLGCFSV